WFEQELGRFIYKPNFEMAVSLGTPFEPAILTVKAKVLDARWRPSPGGMGPGHPPMIKIAARLVIPEHLHGRSELFAEWLLAEIKRVENHETEEWFRRDGEIYRDPHKQSVSQVPVGPIHNNEPDEPTSPHGSALRRLLSRFARP